MAAIVIDFGSSNSGATISPFSKGEFSRWDLMMIHTQPVLGTAKEESCFYVKRELLLRSYDSLTDNDFKILSNVFDEEKSPNIIWTRNHIQDVIDDICRSNDWVRFERFKMKLYQKETTIKGSDGKEYSLVTIIKLFIRTIKLDCLKELSKHGLHYDNIDWGVTIPAVWEEYQKDIMRSIAREVLSPNAMLISEPEGALLGIYLNLSDEKVDFKEGRTTLVVDAGGGTTDIVLVREEKKGENLYKFVEVKGASGRAKGGNEIDSRFWVELCNLLAQEATPGQLNGVTPLKCFWKKFKQDQPAAAMTMEDVYFRFKHSKKKFKDGYIKLSLPGEYWQWLSNEFMSISGKHRFGTIQFPEETWNQIIDEVYEPILEEVRNVSSKCPCRIDKIAVAGGLSCDENLVRRIKDVVNEKHHEAEVIQPTPIWASGAVQFGASYKLSHGEELIDRIARTTFLTDVVVHFRGNIENSLSEICANIKEGYYAFNSESNNTFLPLAKVKKVMEEQRNNMRINHANDTIAYMTPLCVKGGPAYNKHEQFFYPAREGQTAILFQIFSCKDLVIFPSDKLLKLEGELRHEFGYAWKKAKIVIDFNDTPIQGGAKFSLYDEHDSLIKYIDINNVVSLGL